MDDDVKKAARAVAAHAQNISRAGLPHDSDFAVSEYEAVLRAALAAPRPQPDDVKALTERIEAARQLVADISSGKRPWRMCIPPQTDDPDVLLAKLLEDVAAAIAAPRPQPDASATHEEMAEWGDAVAAIGGCPGAPPPEAIDRLVKAGDALNARIGVMTLAKMLHVCAAPRPSGELYRPGIASVSPAPIRFVDEEPLIEDEPSRPSGEREAPASFVAVRRLIEAAEGYANRIDAEAPTGQVSSVVAPIWRLLAAEAKAEIESVARPSPPGERPACQWTEDEDGIWHTGCGRTWFFESGGVEENRQTYCMGCGHRVAAAPFIEGGRS